MKMKNDVKFASSEFQWTCSQGPLGTIQVLRQHVLDFLDPPTHLRQHK